eukprot:1937640-Pleurochrysis_carterae.AAC.1
MQAGVCVQGSYTSVHDCEACEAACVPVNAEPASQFGALVQRVRRGDEDLQTRAATADAVGSGRRDRVGSSRKRGR